MCVFALILQIQTLSYRRTTFHGITLIYFKHTLPGEIKTVSRKRRLEVVGGFAQRMWRCRARRKAVFQPYLPISYNLFLGYNMAVKRYSSQPTLYSIFTLVLLVSTACSAEVTVPDTPTPTPLIIITATLPPTQTPLPSLTPEPATATVAVAPAEGQTISQLNVRSAPSAESDLLGTVEIFANVQIVGKDPTSGWWMIVYPASPTGTGWITAQFVQVSDPSNVPVIGAQPQVGTNRSRNGGRPNRRGWKRSSPIPGTHADPGNSLPGW